MKKISLLLLLLISGACHASISKKKTVLQLQNTIRRQLSLSNVFTGENNKELKAEHINMLLSSSDTQQHIRALCSLFSCQPKQLSTIKVIKAVQNAPLLYAGGIWREFSEDTRTSLKTGNFVYLPQSPYFDSRYSVLIVGSTMVPGVEEYANMEITFELSEEYVNIANPHAFKQIIEKKVKPRESSKS